MKRIELLNTCRDLEAYKLLVKELLDDGYVFIRLEYHVSKCKNSREFLSQFTDFLSKEKEHTISKLLRDRSTLKEQLHREIRLFKQDRINQLKNAISDCEKEILIELRGGYCDQHIYLGGRLIDINF